MARSVSTKARPSAGGERGADDGGVGDGGDLGVAGAVVADAERADDGVVVDNGVGDDPKYSGIRGIHQPPDVWIECLRKLRTRVRCQLGCPLNLLLETAILT